MLDGVQRLHIEMHRQRKLIQFQRDAFRVQRLKIAAQGEIDIGPGMRAVEGAGTEDDGFADLGMRRQDAPDGLDGIWSEAKGHASRVSFFSSKYISSSFAR